MCSSVYVDIEVKMAKTHEKQNTEFISKIREQDSNHEMPFVISVHNKITIAFYQLVEQEEEWKRERVSE